MTRLLMWVVHVLLGGWQVTTRVVGLLTSYNIEMIGPRICVDKVVL